MSGVPICDRSQRGDRAAHAFKSSAVRLATSARQVSGTVVSPSTCGPYAATDRSRSPNTPRRSVASESAVVCHEEAMAKQYNGSMHLREVNVGCVGGGTGLPSLLGGLKANPWLKLNAVVTMFDSGGSSGQLRDQLGVLPPGDVLKCALALARNEREARSVLLARLPALDPRDRLGGHTGGNLLLSMMERYSGDFLSAVDSLRALLGCKGRVWPVTVERATLCAEYADGTRTRGAVEVDAGQSRGHEVRRLWLEPQVSIHPEVAHAIRSFDAVIIGPGSFFTSLLPPLLVLGVREALSLIHISEPT